MKDKKSKNKIFPKIKKNIKDFLLNDEGNINKKDIAKLGLSLSVLSLMLKPEISSASHASQYNPHQNAFFSSSRGGHNSGASHSSHGAHGSHGSHCNCSWGGN